ncbi:MAG: PAS domain S-box protein [candidate division Zixibacteria bacterium]
MDKIRVLYIEDDSIQRRELTNKLRSIGFIVRPAVSGRSGIQFLEKGKFDVILCDLHMPRLGGLAVLKRSLKIAPDVPVIILTGHGTITSAVKAIRQGAHNLVIKPVNINELETIIQQALEYTAIQKRFKQSESMLKMISDNVPDIVYSLDPMGNFLSVNPAGEQVLGYKRDEVLGRSVLDLIHPDDIESIRKNLKESAKKKDAKVRTFDIRMISKSGEVKDLEIKRRLIFENGNIIRNDGIARDVTEQKKLESQLKEYSLNLERKIEERTERLEYSNRQLEALSELSGRLSRIFNEEELFDEVPEFLTHTLDFDRAFLVLFENGVFSLRSYCFEKDPKRILSIFLQSSKSFLTNPPPHFIKSFKNNKTILIPDINIDPLWPQGGKKTIRTKSVVITPIRAKNKPIGLIVGNTHQHRREMDAQDRARFETFANMVGMTLDNIRAYQLLEEKVVERTQSLEEANVKLTDKTKQLEYSTIELAKANIDMLAVQEQLEEKNLQMGKLLEQFSTSKNELQAILDSSSNVILMANNEGKIKAGNRFTREYFGIDTEKLFNTDINDFLNHVKGSIKEQDKFAGLCKRLIENPDPCDDDRELKRIFERSFLLTKPKSRIISLFSTPVLDKNNEDIGRLWIFSDVTALKKAEELIHTIIEASPVPLIITRISDGEILYANNHLGELVGTTAKDLIGRKSPDFYYDPDDRKIVIERLQKDGYLKNFEVRLKKLDGTIFWSIFSLVIEEIGGELSIIGGIHNIQQRKQMEEALRWERNFVSAVLDTAGALVVVLDSEGCIVQFNQACQDTTGYGFDEVRGKHIWDLFLIAEEVEPVKGVFKSLKAGNFPHTYENYWLTRDGSKRLIAWSNTALTNDEGDVEYIISSGIDITEQRKAEENLKLYKEIFMNTSDGITIIDPEGRVIDRNPAHRNYTGFTDAELLGKTPETFICDESMIDVNKAMSSEGSFRGEIVIQNKQGERIDIDLLLFPVYDDEKKLIFYAGMGRDISERKKVEMALRESEERFRNLVENANDIIYSLTPNGDFSYVSPNWTKILGHNVSEVVGRSFAPFVHPDDLQTCMEFFKGVIESGDSLGGVEYRVMHKDGNWRWHTSNASPLVNDDGNIVAFVGVAHDITETRKILDDLENTNKELKKTQIQLIQSEKMASLGMLVAGIAHEINTPIGAVNSMHDTLIRSMEKLRVNLKLNFDKHYEQDTELISIFKIVDDANKVIESGSKRVMNIVRRLRSFARLDEAELQTSDIHEGLEDTLAIIHHEIKHKAVVIKDYGDIPPIPCYPGPLNQVFLNLLINASQAIKNDGEIHISTYQKNNRIYIRIEDNGDGIAPENIERVFDPGFTTKGVGVGTGLGLSICYQIIMDHKGEIKVKSEIGKGTIFTIVLPSDLKEH